MAKDHILHFRCYVQLGRAKDAQELFHRLSPEARRGIEELEDWEMHLSENVRFFWPPETNRIIDIKYPGK